MNVLDVVLVVNCAFRGANCNTIICDSLVPSSAKRVVITATTRLTPATSTAEEWSIQLSIQSPILWQAAQLEFEVSADLRGWIAVETEHGATDLTSYWHIDGSRLTIGLIDIHGERVVDAGEKTVLLISGEGPRPEITLISGLLATEDAQPIEVLPVTLAGSDAAIPTVFELGDNYPNPFNAGTIISYAISEDGQVRLEIFNVLGRRVVSLIDEYHVVGRYEAAWDGREDAGNSVASGMYFYRLTTGDVAVTKKMVLLK